MAHCFNIVVLILCLSVSWATAEQGERDCALVQTCGEVHVSYPFALEDRPECPSFSRFFRLTCDRPSQTLFLRFVRTVSSTGVNSTTLVVANITTDSLIVDITPLNASIPPNADYCAPGNDSHFESKLKLPHFPGPFVISDDNEFGSFGCTEGILLFSNAVPPSPDQQAHIPSPAQAPAPAPSTSEDLPIVDQTSEYTDVHLAACVVNCPVDVGDVTLCGHGRNCCVTGLPTNSPADWRYALFYVSQSPLGLSCKGGTNYATLFHRKSSDLDKGIYRLKLLWALPSKNTKLNSHSPEYNCSNNANFTGVDGVPGYRCFCNPGYKGDGYLKGSGCNEINECLHGLDDCVSTSKCENSPPGNYTCKCKGWLHVGDGRTHGSGCQFSHRWMLGLEIGAALVLLGLMMGVLSRRQSMSHVADKLHQIVQALRSGGNDNEDENAPACLSFKETPEWIEYEEAGPISPQPQDDSIQSVSIHNELSNTPTLRPR